MKNKVIIIGNDHSNTLGVIRTFGENNIKPYVIVLTDNNIAAILKSKYIERGWTCNSELEIIELLINNFKNEAKKPVIIVTSDLIASLIDDNFNILSKKFFLPNINNTQSEIKKYMDKFIQYELAKRNNLNMAQSIKIDLSKKIDFLAIKKLDYPVVIKPLISATGNKDDITICNNIDDTKKAINNFKNKNYKQILLQEFIDYDYECDIAGFCFNKNVSISGMIKKERIWPEKKGSTTYGKVLTIKVFQKEVEKIKNIFKNINYNGIFDIDVFIKNNVLYLNEINFRNGGLSYAYGEANICYYWYLSCINDNFTEAKKMQFDYYFIDDQADLHNVFERKISLKQYIKEKSSAKIKLVSNKHDRQPSKILFFNKIKNKIKEISILKIFLQS